LNDTKVGRESRLFCDFDYISGFNVVFIRLVAKIKKAASQFRPALADGMPRHFQRGIY